MATKTKSSVKKTVSKERLHELFHYEASTGFLIWKIRPREDFISLRGWKVWNARYSGKVAGAINTRGYRCVSFDGKSHLIHRLVWVYLSGRFDGLTIDHINHDAGDNRVENLRLVSHIENTHNQKIARNNKSGITGVFWSEPHGKWNAYISTKFKRTNLGYFHKKEDAISARKAANLKYGFHKNHGVSRHQIVVED